VVPGIQGADNRGMCFLAGSQRRDRVCTSRTAQSSCPGVRSTPQDSQMRVRPWSAALAQPWSRYVRCSVQNTLPQPSHSNGRKSSWLQLGSSQCAPKSGNASILSFSSGCTLAPESSSSHARHNAKAPVFFYGGVPLPMPVDLL
jgi:hypothetical protein